MLRELVELRQEVASAMRRLSALRYRRAAGLPQHETLREVLKAHRLATSADGLSQAGEALADAEAEDPRRPGRVSRLASLRDAVAKLRALSLDPAAAQELFDLSHRALVRPPGDAGLHGALPPVAVDRELPYLAHRDKRGQMEGALAEALEPLDGARTSVWEAARSVIDPLQLHARGWTGPSPRESCTKLLDDTDALVDDLGAWLLERECGARDPERHDVLRLVHAPRCASAFPAGELLRTVRRWAEMFRFDLSALKVDDDDRPLKAPGALAVPIDPPFEVRISVLPQEGPRALAELLGAISVAQLRLGPPEDAPPEDLWLGDPAVEHACHALFATLARDPGFLLRCAKADLKQDDLRAIAIASVFDARLAAARTLASLEALENGPSARAVSLTRELWTRATGATLPRGLALAQLDPWLDGWAEVRGLALAARLWTVLVERFDVDFWRNPRALPALHGLWSRGGRPTAAELWAEVAGEMSVTTLTSSLAAACG